MRTRPLVSVLMPVHNMAPFLDQAVRSILNQTLTELELIAIDDGSTDEAPAILERLAAADPRVRVVRQNQGGQTAAFNRAWTLAQARYVARMDSDDIAYPTRLERQVAELDARPSLAAVGARVRYIDASGSPSPIGYWFVPTGPSLVRWRLLFGTALANPTAMFRRDAVGDRPPCDETYAVAEDYELWVRLAARADLDNLSEVLLDRRVHPASVSHRRSAQGTEEVNAIRRMAAAGLAGVDLSEDEVRVVTATNAPANADYDTLRQASAVVAHLRRAYLAKWQLSPDETNEVARDVARRFSDIMYTIRREHPLLAVRLGVRAVLLRAGLL
jgi:glycosyltransferase involved in cell wall biosynthesis